MNSHWNTRAACLLALLLAGGILLAVSRHHAAEKLRADNQVLAEQNQEAKKLALENQGIPALRQQKAEADKLSADNTELLRLRNEATQLRGQAKELAALQAENQRLVVQGGNIKVSPNRGSPTAQPDFVVKSALRNTGRATPEAAVQTFLWSLAHGDINQLQQCFTAGTVPAEAFNEDNSSRIVAQAVSLVGFRITERKDISPDEVMLGVFVIGLGSSAEGDVAPMPLKRVGNEWKLSGAPIH